MKTEASPIPVSVEQRWARIIAAVRGSAAAVVWFQFKLGPTQAREDAGRSVTRLPTSAVVGVSGFIKI
jgi:hypothetical protein